MRQGYLLYLANRPAVDKVRPCCTDVPAIPVTRTRTRTRPAAIVRWPRKLRQAAPLSVRVFRGSIARPAREARGAVPSVGTQVVTPTGDPVGRISAVLVGLSDGQPILAVRPNEHRKEGSAVVLLLPRASVAIADGGTVVVRQEEATDRVA